MELTGEFGSMILNDRQEIISRLDEQRRTDIPGEQRPEQDQGEAGLSNLTPFFCLYELVRTKISDEEGENIQTPEGSYELIFPLRDVKIEDEVTAPARLQVRWPKRAEGHGIDKKGVGGILRADDLPVFELSILIGEENEDTMTTHYIGHITRPRVWGEPRMLSSDKGISLDRQTQALENITQWDMAPADHREFVIKAINEARWLK